MVGSASFDTKKRNIDKFQFIDWCVGNDSGNGPKLGMIFFCHNLVVLFERSKTGPYGPSFSMGKRKNVKLQQEENCLKSILGYNCQ